MHFSTLNLFLIEIVDGGKKAVKCSLSAFPWHTGSQWRRACVEIHRNGHNTSDSRKQQGSLRTEVIRPGHQLRTKEPTDGKASSSQQISGIRQVSIRLSVQAKEVNNTITRMRAKVKGCVIAPELSHRLFVGNCVCA